MSDALVPTGPEALQVSATTPLEMSQAQDGLIAWCQRKVVSMQHEASELAENLAVAVKNKWRTDTLRRHAGLAVKRVTFYEKLLAALQAGYCIVPNFPVDVFAIRTNREKPLAKIHIGSWSGGGDHTQAPDILPIGEGEYKDPHPFVMEDKSKHPDSSGKEQTKYTRWATKFDESIEFPIQMAKAVIMECTNRAMQLKVFDQFGILLPHTAKADPLIVGEILDPAPVPYRDKKRITFIIAWHLDVRDL